MLPEFDFDIEEVKKEVEDQQLTETELKSYIEGEADAFNQVQKLLALFPPHISKEMLLEGKGWGISWLGTLETIESEAAAYTKINKLKKKYPSLIQKELEAEEHTSEYFFGKYESLLEAIENKLDAEELAARVATLKPALLEMERIIGSEVYNKNTVHSRREKETYRFPLTIPSQDPESKRKTQYANEELIRKISELDMYEAYYHFGLNKLGIFKGLVKIINYLEDTYDIDITKKVSSQAQPKQ